MEVPHIRAKICLVGPPEVGKTNLVSRFTKNEFNEKYRMTLGASIHGREILLPATRDEPPMRVTLVLWDIMGEHNLMFLLQNAYFHAAKGAIAVCDVSRPETVPGLEQWVSTVRSIAGDVPIVLAANKIDLTESCKITTDDVVRTAKDLGCWSHFGTSAKTGESVKRAFVSMAEGVSRLVRPSLVP